MGFSLTGGGRNDRRTDRRLRKVSDQLRRAREELRVIDEQLGHLADDAEDLGVRAVVSDSPEAAYEHRHAQAHADAMARHRAKVVADIAALEEEQDRLLDQRSA